jgi:hypothetical protein
MKKWISLFVFFLSLQASAQYTYTYTDPCTLTSRSVFVPAGGGVMVNYFDNHNTFTANDFSSGAFDAWITLVSQQNSNSPCQSVTTAIVNSITNVTVANTLTVVTNVISVTNVAQSVATIGGSMGSSMTATAGSVTNSSQSEGGSTNQNSKDDQKSNSNTSTGTNTGTAGTSPTGNQNQGGQTNPNPSGGTPSQPSTGTPQQGGETTNPNQPTSTGSPTSESSVEGSSGSGNNLANSLSNSVDGGSADGGSSSGGGGTSGGSKKSNSAAKSVGSLIASGDVVAIANTDQTQNFRFVGSITHANTRGTRIKGVLFNYTSGVNNLNVTFYKSWINKSKKLNTVGAQSIMMDFDKNFFSTTTVLESYKVSNKLTGMFGVNFTAGKMGERSLLNLSAVGGAHSSFKVSDRVSTSILVLGVYSPFTQFYEGKWWDAGVIIVPFNSWDLKITKTFKFNVSFTGVYEAGNEFLNYQILTGGKLTF